jgi:phosphatidylinositol alpha-1,6-mannosyltransferase
MRQAPRIRRLLRDCDVIHSTIEPYAILAAAAAGQRALVITAHGSYVNLPRMRRFPLGQLYRRAFERAELVCVSRHTAQVAQSLLRGARAHVINNGLDATPYRQRPAFEAEKTGPTVVTLGEIKPRKGTLQLVEAMAAVRAQLPDAQCLIMGNPQAGSAYTQRVRDTIERLGLAHNVKILGFVEEELMRAWLTAADVFALPAMNDGWFFEGFGLSLLEASAAGTAVIGTDNCGVADAVDDGVTGLIIPQAQVAEALPRALLELLSDPAKAGRMGAAGREHAQAQTWARVAEQVIEVYRGALN